MTTAVNNNATTGSSTTGTSPLPEQSLGKDDFLKLLTAQLSNQDPLQPVDNQAFIAQLAQFSSLEQMQNVSTKLDSLITATSSSNQLSSASLVGKTVAYETDGVDVPTSGTPVPMQIKVGGQAAVSAVIQDSSGATVRTINLGVQSGTIGLGWDGRDGNGNAVPAGHYTVAVSAKAVDGTDVDTTTIEKGQVQAVSFDGTTTQLVIGSNQVDMSNVLEITQP
jgi:flagellar basal-body rod modification protein FlgD